MVIKLLCWQLIRRDGHKIKGNADVGTVTDDWGFGVALAKMGKDGVAGPHPPSHRDGFGDCAMPLLPRVVLHVRVESRLMDEDVSILGQWGYVLTRARVAHDHDLSSRSHLLEKIMRM